MGGWTVIFVLEREKFIKGFLFQNKESNNSKVVLTEGSSGRFPTTNVTSQNNTSQKEAEADSLNEGNSLFDFEEDRKAYGVQEQEQQEYRKELKALHNEQAELAEALRAKDINSINFLFAIFANYRMLLFNTLV